MDKAAARTWARALPPATSDMSATIVTRLARLDQLVSAGTACLFLPMPGEVDLTPLPDHLPRVRWVTTRTGTGPDLTVHSHDAPRERHPLGYEQPTAAAPIVDPAAVDVWLVPGLAFDRRGTRLGHGRGYYDRLLSQRDDAASVVGVTTGVRLVAAGLPHQAHDVPMDLIVTEDELHQPGAWD